MARLQLIHIAKSYGDNDVLKDISFQLAGGDRIGLVGLNGSGKTTLLRLIAGLDEPDRGEIRLDRRASAGLLQMMPEAAAGDLSGGERTRLALSRLLADQPDLMLLDEPTNNLDLMGIRTTIKLLQDCPASMIIVSHDRYLLDSMVSRVLEIEDGRVVEYAGNYTFYRQEKERLRQERQHRYDTDRKKQQQIREAISQTRQWAEKAHRDSTKADSSGNKMGLKEYRRAKAMKMDKKAKNDVRRLERLLSSSEAKPLAERKVQFMLASDSRHGRRVLEATDLAKSFGARVLFGPSHFYILRQEKVAVFGPNGCGKTTLVRMIQGLEPLDGGQLWLSPNCRPAVLTQEVETWPAGQTVLEWLSQRLGKLDGQDRATLAQMGFSPRHLQQDISSISLGEQMKLKLIEPILTRSEFLILDEPTNFLDLHAREMLEEALASYPGTLLVVSHDLYLLQKVCDKVLVFENSLIRRLEYSFAEYLRRA